MFKPKSDGVYLDKNNFMYDVWKFKKIKMIKSLTISAQYAKGGGLYCYRGEVFLMIWTDGIKTFDFQVII